MKTIRKKLMLSGLIATAFMLFSFSVNRGGDSFYVYFNEKLMLQQFVHADKSVKTIQLSPVSGNDRLEFYYSHCGQVGKKRFLTVKNEDGQSLHVWEYPDAARENANMSLTVKQVTAVLKNEDRFSISYSSAEIPNGKMLVTIDLDSRAVAGK